MFYSAANRDIVMRHFQWMKEYGLDGVLAQRFVTDIRGRRAGVHAVISAAEATRPVRVITWFKERATFKAGSKNRSELRSDWQTTAPTPPMRIRRAPLWGG
jgi:hypothetical protein